MKRVVNRERHRPGMIGSAEEHQYGSLTSTATKSRRFPRPGANAPFKGPNTDARDQLLQINIPTCNARPVLQMCQKATFALQQIFLFDHLVGAGKQSRRHPEAERSSSLEVDQ